MIHRTGLPPINTSLQNSTEREKKPFEPPMNTDEHRLKADKEKQIIIKVLFVFIRQLSVFIGVHRWFKNLCFRLLNQHFVGGYCRRSL